MAREDKLIDARTKDFTLPPHFAVAVSGGVDSVSLLHWLVSLGHKPLVAHYNHRWLPREDGDAIRCQTLAHDYGLAFVTAASPHEGIGTEHAAREERYQFLFRTLKERGWDTLVTAHNAGDQAETVLMRLLRGTGSRGLAGMRVVSCRDGVRIVRPWLRVTRLEIEAYARHHQLSWEEDPCNRDFSKMRAQVRYRMLPDLEKYFGRTVAPSLCRTAELLAAEDDYLTQQAAQLLEECRDRTHPERLVLPRLAAAHEALVRRVLRRWMESAGVPDLSFEDIESARALFDITTPAATNLAGGWILRRREKRLLLVQDSLP